MDADLSCPECKGYGVHECEFAPCPKRDRRCNDCDGTGRRPPTLAEWDALRAERDRYREGYRRYAASCTDEDCMARAALDRGTP